MAKAYISIDSSGRHYTTVYNSEGEFIKRVPTHPSQIRSERTSLLAREAQPKPNAVTQGANMRCLRFTVERDDL